jgi:hypothetical protein
MAYVLGVEFGVRVTAIMFVVMVPTFTWKPASVLGQRPF